MSFVHIRLAQIEQNNQDRIEYLVESFDFNEQKEWEKIGTLLINPQTDTYEFRPEPVWESQKIIPPSVFQLEETQREKVIKQHYSNHGGGAWSMLLHHWATSFLKRASFPKYHPLSFFPEQLFCNSKFIIYNSK